MARKMLDEKALMKEFRSAVDIANKRLERLRNAGQISGAYSKAMRMLGGRQKFSSKNPHNIVELTTRLSEVKSFLSMKTSTLTGIKEVRKSTLRSLRETYGVTLSTDQLEPLFESALWSKLNDLFQGSPTAMAFIGSLQKTKGDVKKAIEDMASKHQYISPTEGVMLSDLVNDEMKDRSIDFLF